ncbi:MAG: Bug family tripartite tricarboxylate transporter substrate binding protein [Rhodoplanes sp.]
MSKFVRISMCAALSAALSFTAQATAAQGSQWPMKPIRMTVSSGAGGGLDLVARTVAAPLSEALGQNVVVDNRAGASGSIAAELAAQAAPDGYTLMVLSASLVVYGVVNKTRYDLFRDFDAVSQIAASPYLLTIHPGLPAQSVKDLIAYARANPGKLNYASTGPASLAHLAGELFAMNTGTQLVHVPYKGVGAALPDMLSGRTQMSFLSGGSVMGQIRTQKLKALAVASPTRSKLTPELPTMIESGVPGFVVTQWHALLAPRSTPRAIIDRLHAEIAKAVKRPEVGSRLALDGTETIASTPKEFAAFLRTERDQWAKVAKAAKIQTQ